jgi:hypothetical protein
MRGDVGRDEELGRVGVRVRVGVMVRVRGETGRGSEGERRGVGVGSRE